MSDINKAMQAAWAEWQVEDDVIAPHLTATKIRKALVTVSRENGYMSHNQLRDLAKHVGHTYETAQKNYSMGNGLTVSRRAAILIMAMIRQPEDNEADDEDPAL